MPRLKLSTNQQSKKSTPRKSKNRFTQYRSFVGVNNWNRKEEGIQKEKLPPSSHSRLTQANIKVIRSSFRPKVSVEYEKKRKSKEKKG